MSLETGAEVLHAAIKEIERELDDSPNFFKQRNTKDLVIYILSLQNKVYQQLSFIEKDKVKGQTHSLAAEHVKILLESAQKGLNLFMRHAEQLKTADTQRLKEEDAKIHMMREPHNSNDPITVLSALNFINHLVLFKFLKDKHDIHVQVYSSANLRALEPATALSILLNKAPPMPKAALSCVNYPAPENLRTAELKALLNKGKLLWNQGCVDAVCGEGSFHALKSQISGLIQSSQPKPKHINLYFTHTQQLQAASDSMSLCTDTFDYFSYVGIDGTHKPLLNEKGFTQIQQAKAPLPPLFRPCSGIYAAVFPDKRGYHKHLANHY